MILFGVICARPVMLSSQPPDVLSVVLRSVGSFRDLQRLRMTSKKLNDVLVTQRKGIYRAVTETIVGSPGIVPAALRFAAFSLDREPWVALRVSRPEKLQESHPYRRGVQRPTALTLPQTTRSPQ